MVVKERQPELMSRIIPLTNSNKVVLIDAVDYKQVSCFTWFLKTGKGGSYAARSVRIGKHVITIRLHRFIMQPADGQDVHHKNGNKLNCCRKNLECIKHNLHAYLYYGAEAKMADKYAEQHCTQAEWENKL